MIQNGLFAGYISGCVYLLVVKVEGDSKDVAHQNRINRLISLIMIVYGLAGVALSNLMKDVNKKWNKPIMKTTMVVVTSVMMLILMFDRYISSIWEVYALAFVMGLAEVGFNLMTSVYLSTTFKGRLEAFTLWKQFCNLFTSLFIISFVYLGKESFFGYLFSGFNLILTLVFLVTF